MVFDSKFMSKPKTVADGGFLKSCWITWLNLGVQEISGDDYKFEGRTERLALNCLNIEAFLEAVDHKFLSAATDKEVENILRYFSVDNDIEAWTKIRKAQIDGFDKSTEVNHFWLNGQLAWIDRDTRLALYHMYQVIGDSEQVPSMWLNGAEFTMPSSSRALEILKDIEIYASACFATTQKMLSEIDSLLVAEDIAGLKTFSISNNYPAPLRIDI